MRGAIRGVAAAAAFAVLVACEGGTTTGSDGFVNSPSGPTASPVATITRVASPTPPAMPSDPPATSGEAGETCVEGWTTPEPAAPTRARRSGRSGG